MLSRLALRSVKINNGCLTIIRPSTSVTKSEDAQKAVTFERPKQLVYPGKVRIGFIPEEWFQFFYPKTGVTGPYVFGTSVLAYLFSKEIWVVEHEFVTGLSLGIFAVFCIKKFGPKVAEFLDKELDNTAQFELNGQTMLYDAKRENIGLQLEAAYRQRLVQIHSEVKKRLDYQLETTNVKTKLEQRHMVNWIVENVRKAITPDQENAALKQCLANLKTLSANA
ncbi:ATP synthase subunit b, mitochondrial [Armadillidium nasatum]|uniref:ATP synthase subunit b n=1 Tax=Armadillidium nasatum TaxID=96803 RepID=A0A5N5SZI7_9CRUS|nr:ATP synthase subunit b, mitochondrial [Armadillidium nasatum]